LRGNIFEDGIYCEFGEALKKHISVPIILANRMDNPTITIEALGKSCDIVSYGMHLNSLKTYNN
jgi:2-enoate reductase